MAVIFFYLSVKLAVRIKGSETLYTFISLTRIDCMAIGGLGAWWANSKRTAEHLVFSSVTQSILWVVFFFGCLGKLSLVPDLIEQELYSVVFIMIILNVSLNSKPLLSLESPVLDWVGRISYGVYLWHRIILYFQSLF